VWSGLGLVWSETFLNKFHLVDTAAALESRDWRHIRESQYVGHYKDMKPYFNFCFNGRW